MIRQSDMPHLTWDTGGLSRLGITITRTSSSLPLGAGGDDGPMSPISEVGYDTPDEELQAGIILFYSALAFRFSPWLPILCTTGQ